ncbi:4-coumarate--CoA ligase 1-like [Tribolium madens]|uniref:4-coumarate--CoA ligase 1-like n=1 Tax=Tribolium madens TaxID=41895 RepID=UPI001CF75733|nr:4-coumarate--CoA ligase 1-like [Tribolium madens]
MIHNKILQGKEFKSTLNNISLGDFFFNYAEKNANKICQIDADLDQSETYSSVKQRTTRLAIHLKKRGITSKDVVAFCSYNSLDNTIPIISSLYLGAKVVSLDPTLSARQTKHLLSLVSPRLIFVGEESVTLIENCLNEVNLNAEIVVFGKSIKYETFSNLLTPTPEEKTFRPEKVDIHDIAVMFFSSGTTGLPKAICHSHYSFLQLTDISNQSGHDTNCTLHFTTFYWISGMLMLSLIFLDGGTRVFARNMEGEKTLKMIEKYRITTLFVAPVYTYELTSVANPEKFDLSSFRCFLTGGTSISTEQYKKLSSYFPQTQILFGYGMSEIGIISVFHSTRDKHFIKTKLGSCGKIVAQTTLKIVNPDTEEILGPHQKGEIRVKSSGLFKGYYNAASSHCFDKDGFLKSGDIGYYDEDGCLYVVGRIKEMFKYLSWHIVPSSIEAILLEHSAVKDAVVFGIPAGEKGEIPAACVVLKDNCCNIDKEEILKFVEERVSEREKLRGGVTFLNELPRTPTGKLIRNEVRNIVIKSM